MVLIVLLAFAALAIAMQAGLGDLLVAWLGSSGAGGVVAVVLTVVIVGGVVFVVVRVRRMVAYWLPKGALAEDFADGGRTFELRLDAGPAVDVILRSTVSGQVSAGSRRVLWGLTVRLDVERQPGADAPPGVVPFRFRREIKVGDGGLTGWAEAGQVREFGAFVRHNEEVTASMVIARIPAGGGLVVRGTVQESRNTTALALPLFLKPSPPGKDPDEPDRPVPG